MSCAGPWPRHRVARRRETGAYDETGAHGGTGEGRGPARRGRGAGVIGVTLVACLVLVACGEQRVGEQTASGARQSPPATTGGESGDDGSSAGGDATPSPSAVPAAEEKYTVDPPGKFEPPLHATDVLVFSQDSLAEKDIARIRKLPGVKQAALLSLSQVSIDNRVINVAAVDPGNYRNFTPEPSARLQDAWDRVAGGEIAADPSLREELQGNDAFVRLGNAEDAPRLHIGAWAPLSPRVDAVVNKRWGEQLGIRENNAMLLSTGITAPRQLRKPLGRILGEDASVQMLDAVARYGLDPNASQNAVLVGGSVARKVGTFSYQVLGQSGRIDPERSWEKANIRTEQVPLLGKVTCHKVMLRQLRAALREVAVRGLGPEVYQTAGCYYPRFIAGTTKLSLHSFGIAIDINSKQNQRGTRGEMDRTVVKIFKKWGFAWGGDWDYTDPMHFQLERLVEVD